MTSPIHLHFDEMEELTVQESSGKNNSYVSQRQSCAQVICLSRKYER